MLAGKLSRILVLLLVLVNSVDGQDGYYKEIRGYSDSLFNSLDDSQKKLAVLSPSDSARLKWNNLPVGLRARVGLNIGGMTVEQRKFLHRILSSSLSSQGYLKATGIMHLDDLLNNYYERLFYRKEIDSSMYALTSSLKWTHKNYFFAFFGQPNDSAWGFKLEGHHLSINFTFIGEQISVTPLFVGTDPAEYPDTEYAGWRVLGQEEDLGIKFINMLTPRQRKQATMSTEVPEDIITGAESGKRLIDYWGLKAKDMTSSEKKILEYMIREFVFNLEYEKATIEYEKILKAGIDNIYFGWIGDYVEEYPHYYVINGPTFLIEFDNRSGGPRKAANHIHAIWREKGNEFGEDILKRHYQTEKH